MSIPVLDAGALIGLERRDPRLIALIDEIVRNRMIAFMPAGVLAQVWRGDPRQHAIARLLKTKTVRVEALDEQAAMQVGTLLGTSGSSDVVDAHVALLAARVRGVVYTSDPDDLRALNQALPLIEI